MINKKTIYFYIIAAFMLSGCVHSLSGYKTLVYVEKDFEIPEHRDSSFVFLSRSPDSGFYTYKVCRVFLHKDSDCLDYPSFRLSLKHDTVYLVMMNATHKLNNSVQYIINSANNFSDPVSPERFNDNLAVSQGKCVFKGEVKYQLNSRKYNALKFIVTDYINTGRWVVEEIYVDKKSLMELERKKYVCSSLNDLKTFPDGCKYVGSKIIFETYK